MIRFFQNLFAGRKTNYLAELPAVNTKIEIYKADWCSHCRTALRLLSKINATNIHIYDIEKQRDKGHENGPAVGPLHHSPNFHRG